MMEPDSSGPEVERESDKELAAWESTLLISSPELEADGFDLSDSVWEYLTSIDS